MKARIYFKNGMVATIEVQSEDTKDVVEYVKSKFPSESEIEVEPIK